MENRECCLKLRFFYVALILILVIIELLTVQWGSQDQVVKLISFAATLTSLFLSLLAIIYAFYSSSSFTRNVGDLQDASKNISKDTQKLSEATAKIEERVAGETQKLSEATTRIGKEVSGLLPALTEMHKSLSDRQDKLMESFSRVEVASKTGTTTDVFNDAYIDNLLKYASYPSLLALYACSLAKEKGKFFSFKEISTLSIYPNFLTGFLSACYSIDILDYQRKDSFYTIKRLNERIKTKILEAIQARIKSALPKEEVEEDLGNIRDYFDK